MNFISNLAESTWKILVDSAFLLLVGIFLAGLLHILLDRTNLDRIIKGSKNFVVLKAALFGIPLPLCSCSVLPMADQLRRSGMNKGGIASFLISTPETGIDSILLTYSLTDPLMTVARPISAFITALSAGIAVNLTDIKSEPNNPTNPTVENCCSESPDKKTGLFANMKEIVDYSFNTLLKDLAPYLFLGYLLAGLVGVVIGNSFDSIPDFISSGWGGYVGAIAVGLPMYICATSSTPLAAVLLGAGFSPGAILVFLLVGPATNVASLTVVGKIIKKKAVFVYLASIIIISIFAGISLDYLYELFTIETDYKLFESADNAGIIKIISGVLLTILICYFCFLKYVKKLKQFFLV